MTDLFAIVVAVTVAVHLAFVGYGVLGGFLALRWPKTIWVHVPVVLWCVAIEVVDFVCPLTALERWARARAGMPPLPSDGFIDHYITGVLYPARDENLVLGLVLVAVLVSWVLVVRTGRRRAHRVSRGAAGSAARVGRRRTAAAGPRRRSSGSVPGNGGR